MYLNLKTGKFCFMMKIIILKTHLFLNSTCTSYAPAVSHCLFQLPSRQRLPRLLHRRRMPQWGPHHYSDYKRTSQYFTNIGALDTILKLNRPHHMPRDLQKKIYSISIHLAGHYLNCIGRCMLRMKSAYDVPPKPNFSSN